MAIYLVIHGEIEAYSPLISSVKRPPVDDARGIEYDPLMALFDEFEGPGGTTILKPSVDIDISNCGELGSRLETCLGSGKTVILDLSDVSHLDSSALGLFVLHVKKPGRTGRLRITGLSPDLNRLISISRLDSILPIYESIQVAAAARIPRVVALVEPDEGTSALIVAVLDAHNYAVFPSRSIEGLDRSVRYDLLIFSEDLETEAAAAALSLELRIPVLYLDKRKKDGIRIPGEERLIKPFDPYDLLGKVRILLEDRAGVDSSVLICVVERDAREDIGFILKKHGYDIHNVPNFGSVISELRSKDWDILIAGIDLPDGTLESSIPHLRKNEAGANLPVIAVGDPPSRDEIVRLVKRGIGDYLSIPIQPEALLGKVAKAVETRISR